MKDYPKANPGAKGKEGFAAFSLSLSLSLSRPSLRHRTPAVAEEPSLWCGNGDCGFAFRSGRSHYSSCGEVLWCEEEEQGMGGWWKVVSFFCKE